MLIGDAAHTAHFSIGSGTKLAMEDAIALVARTAGAADVPAALAAYQDERETEALKLQSAARNRMRWFEEVARYAKLEPWQFTYSLLTGSQRIGHANLKLRDPAFVAGVEARLAERAGAGSARPPMFLPFEMRGMRLENRIVVSPMAQYSAKDGMPDDWHLVHLGARATGGAGLVFTEMTCVSAAGRITPGCTGIWNAAQRDAWRRIVDFVHAHSRAKLCLQLGHSGRKGSTQLGWQDEDRPLPSGNWETLAPSPLPYLDGISMPPREMTRADMDRVLGEFVQGAHYALAGRLRHARAAHGARLPARELPLAADQPAQRTDTAATSAIACAIRSRSWPPCARRGPSGRSRYASPRATGRRAGSPRTSWSPIGARDEGGRAPTSSTSRAARPCPGRSRCTAACGRRRSPTWCATSSASRRSRSATSSRPTTRIRSSPPAAPISARSRGRTSPIRPGRCARRRSSSGRANGGRRSTCSARRQLERNLERAAQAAGPV